MARTWKVGALAKLSGITVRTLHHYDELGLVSPSHRSDSLHRVYGEADLLRLQQVLSLRQLGFPLEEIRSLLAEGKLTPLEIVRLHRVRVEEERTRMGRLYDQLSRLEQLLSTQAKVSLDALIQTIEVIQMYDKYFSKEQLAQIKKQGEKLGPERIQAVQDEWPRLIAAVREEMQKGTDPSSARLAPLARRWDELVQLFTGGNAPIAQRVSHLYRQEPQMREKTGLDADLMAYVQKALAALK